MTSLPVYVGWDPNETVAYDVAIKSLTRHATHTLDHGPIKLEQVTESGLLTRPIERRDGKLWCPISQAPMATEFAISRFCVPFLRRFGWALFVDSDVMFRADVAELFALAEDRYAVMVVKHTYIPTELTKMHGAIQTIYSRKNWSSVVLWNVTHPSHKRLTKHELNTWPGRDLHAFKWLDDSEIGELPRTWNYLVGVPPKMDDPCLAHFTHGVPSIPGYDNSQFADEWRSYNGH